MAIVMMQTWMVGLWEDLQEVLLMAFVGTPGNNSIKSLKFVNYKSYYYFWINLTCFNINVDCNLTAIKLFRYLHYLAFEIWEMC